MAAQFRIIRRVVPIRPTTAERRYIPPATLAALLDDRAAAGLCDDRPNLFTPALTPPVSPDTRATGLSGNHLIRAVALSLGLWVALFLVAYFAMQGFRAVFL